MLLALFLGVSTWPATAEPFGAPSSGIVRQLDVLVAAYPEFLLSHNGNYLLWKDGTRMPISDGNVTKDFNQLLDSPDIDDMFAFPYPTGSPLTAPGANVDPGRIRYEPMFLKMYGDCHQNEVKSRLRPVSWLPHHDGETVEITAVNGADQALQKISQELDQLPEPLIRYLKPTYGTYHCRTIAGTKRYSAHAYGIAIDINTRYGDYWRWTKAANGALSWRNQIPAAIVEIFERYGFIWGGRWYHFDTLHFEYRPELLDKKSR